ncbi:MAG: anthranilate phosphoribosyltransferase [Gammaproteobacteria bacterium]|jgi:anthranilate phosphoribosyltransferase
MAMDSKDILEALLEGQNLAPDQAASLMKMLADESMMPARAGALLAALRAKGETADEIRGFATAMRELARKPKLPDGIRAADSVGTGGDRSGSFNLSTGSALLAAASGVPMVKHGNRSVSSKSGSSDVLQALGYQLPADPEAAVRDLQRFNFTFLFAPVFHPAMKAIAPVRAALGVRTLFNILGPLSNPAEPPFHLIGAYSIEIAKLMADTLSGMQIERAFVVHGEPGWDEATPVGAFELFIVTPGAVRQERRDPADYGIPRCSATDLAGGDAIENASALEAVLNGDDTGAHRDALLLGAGLVLELTGASADLNAGLKRAADALESTAAAQLLSRLRGLDRGQ